MKVLNIEELSNNFDFPFSRDNFSQWLLLNRKRLTWFFHTQKDFLLVVLKFEDGGSASIKIFANGELKLFSTDINRGKRTLALLHLVLNEDLPLSWENAADYESCRKVILSFTGQIDEIRLKGSLINLAGDISEEMNEVFDQHAEKVSNTFKASQDYLKRFFLRQERKVYTSLVLSSAAQHRLYEFYRQHLHKRWGWEESQLERCFFLFSDSTLVSFKDIYFHPYAALIGTDFFEHLSFKRSSIKFNPSEFLYLYSSRADNNFVKNVIFQVLENSELLLAKDLQEDNVELLKVKSLLDPSKEPSQWKITKEDGRLFLECRPFEAYKNSCYLGGSAYYDLDELSLFHNSFEEERNFWKYRYADAGSLKKLDPEKGAKALMPIDLDPESFFYDIQEFNRKFEQNIAIDIGELPAPEFLLNVELVDKDKGEVHFSFSPSLKLKNEFEWDHIETISFPKDEILPVLDCLAQGLGAYFYQENTYLAPHGRGKKRQNCLKLLRHAGFFHLLFHLTVAAKGDPEKEKNLKQEIKQLALAVVLNIVEDDPKEIERLWTKEFGSKIIQSINKFLKDFQGAEKQPHIFQINGEFFELDYAPLMENFYLYLSGFLKNALDEKVLVKQRFKDFQKVPDHDSPKQKIAIQLTGALDAILLTENFTGGPVSIEGKAIENLDVSDINSLFKINENAGAIDWFELHPEVFLKGKKVDSAEDLVFHGQQCVEHQGQFYFIPQKTLPKIKWLDYFWKKLASKSNKKKFSWESKIEQIPKSQTLELLAMQEAGIPVEGGPRWEEISAEFKKLKNGHPDSEDLFEQKGFHVPLKNFQKTGTSWMLDLYKMGLGGILADDMGLGKTIQSIGALEWLRLNRKMGHCLVVVPTSLTYNWMAEIERFAPKMPCFNFAGLRKNEHKKFLKSHKHSLTVITYGLFARNCRELQDETEWNIVLFDEAQNLKNITATRTGYARKFPAASKFCLTGTPMENHYGEFYSLVDLVVPGALGSYSDFLKTYNFQASKGFHPEKLEQELEYLKLKTAPLVMRRNKEKVLLELPDKSETTIKLDFEKKQEKIYRNIAIAYNQKIKEVVDVKGSAKSQLEILSAILRLRQACSYPAALPEIKYDKEPPKIEALIGQISQIVEEGHKALIFTNFKSTLNAIEGKLESMGIKTFSIQGSTPKRAREKRLKAFKEANGGAVMAMTLKTGGVGLNLTAANYVFHIEPWWNPAAENQATDRSHRMGQEKKVQVYRYIMRESIEEKIETLKMRKSLAIEGLFSEDAEHIKKSSYAKSGLSYDDFRYLLDV